MTLKLYYHPLSSFCWKALIALYETGTPFEPVLVDLQDETSRAKFLALWPIGKFPVLRDEARDRLVPESSIIIEYLDQYGGRDAELLSADRDVARQIRMRDRFFDLYLHMPVQRIVGERLRPKNLRDSFGADQARAQLRTGLGMLEEDIATKEWAMGPHFTMADCAAAPALFYADKIDALAPFKQAKAYLERLMGRPSFARVIKEAGPYFAMFPSQEE